MTNARDLSNHLAELLRREQHAMADFLVALAEFDSRRAWEELGHASLFAFLRVELKLSAGAAQYRKTAAELIRRYPGVEQALRRGQLCLSSVVELGKVITSENAAEVLPRFYGRSSREAAEIAVSIRPVQNPPAREVVTAPRPASVALVPAPASAPPCEPDPVRAPEARSWPAAKSQPSIEACASPAELPSPPPRHEIDPLSASTARLHVTVSRRLLAKLDAARAALSHSRPGATTDEILEAGLDLLLAQHGKRKGLFAKPRSAPPATPPSAPSSRNVPVAVRREAWKRSGGRCEWPLESGGVCGSTLRLEFDHVLPLAHGGSSTIDNIRVCCRHHNLLAARQAFGEEWMGRFRRKGTAAPEDRSPARNS